MAVASELEDGLLHEVEQQADEEDADDYRQHGRHRVR